MNPRALRELKALHGDIVRILHDVEELDETAPVAPEEIQARLRSIKATGRDSLLHVLKYYLHEGRDIFGLETALVAQFDAKNYIVRGAVTDLPVAEGMTFKLCDTYCKQIHDTGTVYALPDVAELCNGLTHPVYKSFKLRAYIGAPIWLGDRLFGSISFSSTTPRAKYFGYEQEVVQVLAGLVAQCLVASGVEELD
jgi:GAF domain-containing protein